MGDLRQAWDIHARIQLYVLDAVADEALTATAAGMKGRTIGHQFSHIHDVRRMWLESAAADLLDGVDKLGKDHTGDRVVLHQALTTSAAAVGELVERAEAGGRIKGFKGPAAAFVAYLVSHESYHQGDIGVRLTQCGFPLDRKTAFGMWEWGVR